MSKTTDLPTGDVVLQEIWRIKDALSASYGHDVKRLFAETRKHEKLSGHPLVEPPKRRKVEATVAKVAETPARYTAKRKR